MFVLRDLPEVTGDEPDDMDFDLPKIYEPVSNTSPESDFHFLFFMLLPHSAVFFR